MDILQLILPILLGIIAGYYIAEYVITIYYHWNFLSEEQYLQLYGEFDSEYHFKTINVISDTQFKSYAEYSKQHESYRKMAHGRFRKIINSMFMRVGLVIIVPCAAFIFLNPFSTIAYIIGLILSIYFYSHYLAVNKKQTRDFYITLVASLVLKG